MSYQYELVTLLERVVKIIKIVLKIHNWIYLHIYIYIDIIILVRFSKLFILNIWFTVLEGGGGLKHFI